MQLFFYLTQVNKIYTLYLLIYQAYIDPFPCSKQYSFHINMAGLHYTSRTLFLLASTQGVSCRLVMNHLINMYMFSLTPPHIYVSKCMYVYVHISLFLPECACTTISLRWTTCISATFLWPGSGSMFKN
jgi:hypothetical protein